MRLCRAHTFLTDRTPGASGAGRCPLRGRTTHAPEGVFLHVK